MLGRTHNLKSARLRLRRRKAFIGRVVLTTFYLAGLWGSIFLLSGLGAVTIRNIEVAGTVSVSPQEIATTAQQFLTGRYFFTVPRASIFFYPKDAIVESILRSFPRAERIAVGFKNFHTIGISITEHQAAALWCQGEALTSAKSGGEVCFLLDSNGFIFAPFSPLGGEASKFMKFYSASPKENPIKQTYSSTEYFHSLLGFAKDLASIGFSVSLFRERPDADFEVQLLGGQRLIFGRDANFASIINNFQTIVSDPSFSGTSGLSKVDYIDLRYGNKVFYKTK